MKMLSRRIKGLDLLLVRRWASLPEYTETPMYPPILDVSNEAVKRRKEEKWHDEIKALGTVEEKLMKANMPRYYGWPCTGLYENYIPYGSKKFAQYVSRTYCYEDLELPRYFETSGIGDNCEPLVSQLRDSVKEAIILEHTSERNLRRNKHSLSNEESMLQQINRVIMEFLAKDFPYLLSSQVQQFPRMESFWIVGGIDCPVTLEKMKRHSEDKNKPVNIKIQYYGNPVIQVRHELPLLPVVHESEAEYLTACVPVFKYDPRVLTHKRIIKHVTNIPGFWPGDIAEYPFMSFHNVKHLAGRTYGDESDALYTQAILASFAWLQAVATYQGFSTYHDVTYPLVTQTILSDGQYWSFYVYQLNTLLLHSDNCDDNSLCNLCWGTKKIRLYEGVENGEVVGFNDEVLRTLLCFYLNAPHHRTGVEMKPYLKSDTKHIGDITEDEKRIWLEKAFKHMYSNRKRHRLPYEIYDWEKIYKIRENTRPMDARRRPFELGVNQFQRRYDDHSPKYVPKALRVHKREKWAKTYYP